MEPDLTVVDVDTDTGQRRVGVVIHDEHLEVGGLRQERRGQGERGDEEEESRTEAANESRHC